MNVRSCFRPAILAAILVQSVAAGPLDRYRRVNRLIVVSLPQESSAEPVAAALLANRAKLKERDLLVIDALEGAPRIPTALRLPPDQTHSLRKQLKLGAEDSGPVFILVGKDGGEKGRQHGILDPEKWFALVDEMPMRRQEIQTQQRKSE